MCLSTLTRWFRKVTENKFGTTWKFRQHMLAQSMTPLEERVTPDATYFNLAQGNFSQNWSNAGLITANDNWTGVPSIIGYLGDDSATTATGVDPQTVTVPFVTEDVIANQTNPNTNISGGVAEFDTLANPVVALQGSGTADAPYLQLHLNTTGRGRITISYNLRDIDSSADNAVQPVALQYRIGNSGPFINIPAGFVADATTGPSLATQVTNVSVQLPPEAENQSQVQVRIITTNAAGSDEWVGVDDISVTGSTFAFEPFTTGGSNYSVGNLVPQGPTALGFTGTWFNSNNNSTIVSPGLTYSGLGTSGGRLDVNQTSRVGRVLGTTYDNTSNTSFYARLLVNLPTSDATQYRAVELYNSSGIGSDANRVLQLGQNSTDFGNSNWGLRLFNNNAFLLDLGAVAAGTTEMFILKFDFSTTNDADKVTVWRNPTATGVEPTGGQVLTGFNMNLAQFVAANFGASTVAFGVDEIAFGSNWGDVAMPASMSATLSTGVLTINDYVGNANNLSAKVVGTDLVFTDSAFGFAATSAGTLSNNGRTLTVPLAGITGKVVVNGGAGNDNFTLDWTGGAFTKNFDFAGGGGTDTFTTTGGTFTTITSNYSNANDGNLVFGQSGNTVTLNYTGLAPVLINAGSVDDLIFNLPLTASSVTLGDDGTSGNKISRLSSSPATFEQTDFTNPTKSLTINRGNASDTIKVAALPDFDRSLTIGASTATFGPLTFTGNVSLASGFNLTAFSSKTILLDIGVKIAALGAGSIGLTTDRDIGLNSGASISVVDGGVTLAANTSGTTSGNFNGIQLSGGTITTSGTGAISLTGRGGNDAGTGNRFGIFVVGSSVVESTGTGATAGSITMVGQGGSGTQANEGIDIRDFSDVRSVSGAISLSGTGGAGTAKFNEGIVIGASARVRSTGTGANAATVQLTGTGGGSGGGTTENYGFEIWGSGSVESVDGNITVTATDGAGTGGAAFLMGYSGSPGKMVSTGKANISIVADSANIGSAATIDAGSSTVTLRQKTTGTQINLGGADGSGTLGLTDAELDTITAGTTQIGDANSGQFKVSAAITHGNNLSLTTGAGIEFNQSVTMAAGKNLDASAKTTISLQTATSDLTASGAGSIGLTTERTIVTGGGSSIVTGAGGTKLSANRQVTTTSGFFDGIFMSGGSVTSAGNLTIEGTGGDAGSTFAGVRISGAFVSGGGAGTTLKITGDGGVGAFTDLRGVHVASATVTTTGGDITVLGTGGGTGASSNSNYGVSLVNGGAIVAGGSGKVDVTGLGGANATGNSNFGVWVFGSGSRISSTNGDVDVFGFGGGQVGSGSAANVGVMVSTNGLISAGSAGQVSVTGTGASTDGSTNYGVYVLNSGEINSGGGAVSVAGF
ncbi:MAG: hypothetical protein K1X57_21180, partial [Gemmataceae bacterium]|nr:hypothetical protein [Gemmataceae bacterium]